jgi:hypothetical protein
MSILLAQVNEIWSSTADGSDGVGTCAVERQAMPDHIFYFPGLLRLSIVECDYSSHIIYEHQNME